MFDLVQASAVAYFGGTAAAAARMRVADTEKESSKPERATTYRPTDSGE